MDRLDYAQGVVIARVYEKRLLERSRIERLVDAKDAQEAFKLLMETEYAKSSDGVSGPENYELLLKNETSRLFRLGKDMLQDKRILQILSLKYDYHNIKTILKSKILKKDLSDLYIHTGDINPEVVSVQFDSGHFTNLPSELKEALINAQEKYSETSDPQLIDIEIDKMYFRHLEKIADELEIELFEDYVKGVIDFYNISTMLRASRMGKNSNFLSEVLVDGGNISKGRIILLSREDFERVAFNLKSEKIGSVLMECVDNYKENGSLTVLDSAENRYLAKLNSESRFISFGPEPIFAYLIRKENEIDMIRLIMVGKMNNIPSEKLRERLGDYLV